MYDVTAQFLNEIRETGLEPPPFIEPGKLYRFPGIGKGRSNSAGWCKLFEDGQGGCFGDWTTGMSENWHIKRDQQLKPEERAALNCRISEARMQAEESRHAQQVEACRRAAEIWKESSIADEYHPYFVAKGIKSHGIRFYKGQLVVPVRNKGQLQSLQFIGEDGSKRFLSGGKVAGGYFSIGSPETANMLCIAEGVATGATVHEATGQPVAIAFNAGNLRAVALSLRQRFPDIALVICADDDVTTAGNPGLSKATETAKVVSGVVATPDFGNDRPAGVSDFNDMALLYGLDAVGERIQAGILADQRVKPSVDTRDDSHWAEPLPLTTVTDPGPYPLDALPVALRAAIEEVQDFAKAPLPLVASSALAALSLAVQSHVDVKRAEKLTGPTGLFLLTIADSGERKSTCDGFFTSEIKAYESEQADLAKPDLANYRGDKESWEARRSGVKEKIRQLAKQGKSDHEQAEELRQLEAGAPVAPRVPKLLRGDETPESLAWSLARDWPSGGILSSEAGIIFGAHGMGSDSLMRNLALLNILWDGGVLSVGRKSSESFTISGARLTVALQVQEATLRAFFERSGDLARGTGFLARFLIAKPESTQGYRPFSEAPAHWPALEEFNQRIRAILEWPDPIDDEGSLHPQLLPLSPKAKELWINFHDEIEKGLRSDGELHDVRDVASKTADNAVRLATLLHVFKHGITDKAVDEVVFEGASRIAAWHLAEAKRFLNETVVTGTIRDAMVLERWLLQFCDSRGVSAIPRREVQRNVTPVFLRKKAALDPALATLCEADRARAITQGTQKSIQLNPRLLKEYV